MLFQGREPGAARLTTAFRLLLAQVALCLLVAPALAAVPGEPVVLLHGFDSSPDLWRGTSALLQEHGYRPISISWAPGEGEGAVSVGERLIAPEINAALAEAGFSEAESFHIVAHSLGGLIARQLLEHPGAASRDWPERVKSLIMLSTPHQGVRTGLASFACRHFRDRRWRETACDMRPGSAFLERLGRGMSGGPPVPYLSIGVESPRPFLLVPPFDGDGDGRARGNDNAVMAESAALDGAPFVLWRGLSESDHFTASCSSVVNGWILQFLGSRSVPEPRERRMRSENICPASLPATHEQRPELR